MAAEVGIQTTAPEPTREKLLRLMQEILSDERRRLSELSTVRANHKPGMTSQIARNPANGR